MTGKIFLDSGAFSAWSKGKVININDYIDFIKRDKQRMITTYANLDVIGNSPETWNNQLIMEENGLDPLPVFHYGEDKRWLKRILNKGYTYIGLGGMVPISNKSLIYWLDDLFKNYLTDNKGKAKLAVHAFGLTALNLVLRYPWYSIDSSSWQLRGSAYGLIDLPSSPGMLTKEEHFYTKSLPISKGIKNFNTTTDHPALFEADKISQFDVSFLKKPKYKSDIEKFMGLYGFTLEELQNDSRMRAVWNAIYLITTTKKFNKDVIIYLATSDFKSLELLKQKIHDESLNFNINVLTSFINTKNKSKLEKLHNLITK